MALGKVCVFWRFQSACNVFGCQGWIRFWIFLLKYNCVEKCCFHLWDFSREFDCRVERVHPWHANTLQADWNLSVHTFYLEPPGVKKVLLKVKLLDFWEQTLLKQLLMIVAQILNRASLRAAILTKWYKQGYQKSASPEDTSINKKQKHKNKSCHLSQHTTHRCVT